MIPSGFIQDLLTRVDIVGIVGRHVELRKAGINHKGLCPFHGEKTPSFIVSPTRQTYHCFGCGAHGDAVRFLTEFVGLGFVEAVSELAQQVGMTVPEDERSPAERQAQARKREEAASLSDVLAHAAQHYRQQLKAHPRAIEYLKGRGLTGEVAARYGIGYAPKGWRGLASVFPAYDDPRLEESGLVINAQGEAEGDPQQRAEQRRYDRFRDRIMFPIRSVQGDVIGFGGRVLDNSEPKYLNSPETPVFIKGRELYGLFEARTAIRQAGHVLVVEGYMDVVALAQLGLGQAVATLGTACTEDHVRKLFRFTDSVVFSFDGDAAGRKAAARALEASLPHAGDQRSIRFLFLPPEHDPDSYIREHGQAAFARLIDKALPLSKQMVEQAQAGCEMDTPEGRARFANQARPLWTALPEGALRRQMLNELARAAALPAGELESLWIQQGQARDPRGGGGVPQGRTEGRAREFRGEPAVPGAAAAPQGSGSAPGTAARRGTWSPRSGWQDRDPLRRGAALPSLRQPPRSPADLATHLLLTHPVWWQDLGADDLDLLHRLGPPHAALLQWLERDIEEHGPRPWAAVQRALEAEPSLARAWRLLPAAGEGMDPSVATLRRALDTLRLEDLRRQQTELAQRATEDPSLMADYRAAFERWRALKLSLDEPES